jgi:hypothetical protein
VLHTARVRNVHLRMTRAVEISLNDHHPNTSMTQLMCEDESDGASARNQNICLNHFWLPWESDNALPFVSLSYSFVSMTLQERSI